MGILWDKRQERVCGPPQRQDKIGLQRREGTAGMIRRRGRRGRCGRCGRCGHRGRCGRLRSPGLLLLRPQSRLAAPVVVVGMSFAAVVLRRHAPPLPSRDNVPPLLHCCNDFNHRRQPRRSAARGVNRQARPPQRQAQAEGRKRRGRRLDHQIAAASCIFVRR